MKLILGILLGLSTSLAMAQTKAEIKQMLEQFKSSGTFSAEEIKAAEKQLEAMSDDDINKIKAQADQKMKDPEVQKKLKEFQASQQE